MEQSKNPFAGQSKAPFPSVSDKEKSGWKLPNDASSYHASTDASSECGCYSNDDLRQIFGAYGEVKEQLGQEQEQDEARLHQASSPLADSPPGMFWTNYGSPVERNSLHDYSPKPKLGSLRPVGSSHLTGLASILPSHASNPAKIAPIGKDLGRMAHTNQVVSKANNGQGMSFQNHSSTPDPNISSSSLDYSKPASIGMLSGPQFVWGSPSVQSEHANSSAWSSSLKAHPFPSSGQGVGFPYPSQRGWLDLLHLAAFGVTNFGRNGRNHAMNAAAPGAVNIGVAFAGNYTGSGSSSSRMMSMTRNRPIYYGNGSYLGHF
ncbi:hypothetical protein SASPL_154209 [Salvia splendens]|uniref:Uncharacterized protein n=1 Tax=Salvia splendens TaxID=180675 RepID=A0A8X8VZY1_SALSN|nr:hypothetical protein SASPL_154209 [Salvia splendens]